LPFAGSLNMGAEFSVPRIDLPRFRFSRTALEMTGVGGVPIRAVLFRRYGHLRRMSDGASLWELVKQKTELHILKGG